MTSGSWRAWRTAPRRKVPPGWESEGMPPQSLYVHKRCLAKLWTHFGGHGVVECDTDAALRDLARFNT